MPDPQRKRRQPTRHPSRPRSAVNPAGPTSSSSTSAPPSGPRTRPSLSSPKEQRPAPLPDRLRFYDLRHTCASLLIAQGASVKAVQAQLGHATASITIDTYGHLFPSEMDTLGDRLELVRDAAVTRRERTQHGPADDRLGEPQVDDLIAWRRLRGSNPRGSVNPLHAFQACAFDRSAKPPPGSLPKAPGAPRQRSSGSWLLFEVDLDHVRRLSSACSTVSPWLVASTSRQRATYQSPSWVTTAVRCKVVGSAMGAAYANGQGVPPA
jgi:hypothetical protein